MAIENYWGQLPNVENLRTPTSILKEQAAILSEVSNRVLEGQVIHNSTNPNQVQASLVIAAPALGNFRVHIVTIQHSLVMYPLTLTDNVKGITGNAITEEDFQEKLKVILGSESIKKVIASLLVQIRSLTA